MNADPPKRIRRFGPLTCKEIEGRAWSLGDLWFCVVAMIDHDGDHDALADTFIDAPRSHGNHDRGADEAKLSHVTNLRARLGDVNLVAADLAGPDLLADQKITRRAREKVTGRVGLEGRAHTPAMIETRVAAFSRVPDSGIGRAPGGSGAMLRTVPTCRRSPGFRRQGQVLRHRLETGAASRRPRGLAGPE